MDRGIDGEMVRWTMWGCIYREIDRWVDGIEPVPPV